MKSRHATSRHSPAAVASSSDRWLLGMVDFGLAATIIVGPWFMGGRHPLGEFVLVSLAVVTAMSWLVRQCLREQPLAWSWSGAEVLLVIGIGLALVQLSALPHGVLTWLSPHHQDILPLWSGHGEFAGYFAPWRWTSLTPEATRASLVMFLSYAMCFLVAVHRIECIEDVERILTWLAASAVVMAVLGLAQYLLGNGKFLWIYAHPSREPDGAVMGTFINKNHFAHLLALGVGPLIWLVQRSLQRHESEQPHSRRRPRSPQSDVILVGKVLTLGIVMFAGAMSISRGGIAMLGLATLVSGGLLYRASLLSRKVVLAIGGAVLLLAAALGIHGYQSVASRLSEVTEGSIEKLDYMGGRRNIWAADASAFKDYLFVGSGLGSHREIYPLYMSTPVATEYTHAECGYLQLALEAGLPGLALLLAGLGLCGYWCAAGLRTGPSQRVFVCSVAVTSSLMVSAAHSLIDFVWYISSLMAITTLLAACAFRLYCFSCGEDEFSVARRPLISRPYLATAAAGLAVLGCWMTQNRFCAAMASPHWDTYLRSALSPEGLPTDPAQTDALVQELRSVLAWTPDDARAHVRLAALCLRRFDDLQKSSENAMALSQIRDAAMSSQFTSRGALDQWLSRAIGQHRGYLDAAMWHARRGVRLCPLLGEGYVYLSELCFLSGARPSLKSACVDQAVLVRPYNGRVLFAAGGEAALAGDVPGAMKFWRRTFASGSEERGLLLDALIGAGAPPAVLLENFQPDADALHDMCVKYKKAGNVDMKPLLTAYLTAATARAQSLEGAEATNTWLEVIAVAEQVGDPMQALSAARQALASDDQRLDVRRALVRLLMGSQQFREAEEHLQWCCMRQPDEPQFRQLLETAVKSRLKSTISTQTATLPTHQL